MGKLSWLFAGLLLVSLAGCEKYVVSLKPLSTDESCVPVPGFEGKWASDGQVWTVRSDEPTVYRVRVSDMASVAEFYARAQQLGTHLFLDLIPAKSPEDAEVPAFHAAHWLQASSFMKMQLRGDAMNLERLNSDHLQEMLAGEPDLIKHIVRDDSVVLVDETEALSRFVQAQVDVNELWQVHGDFVRCAPLYSPQDLIQLDGLTGRWMDPNESDQGQFEVHTKGDHYSIQFNGKSDERVTFSVHLFKLQEWTLMGMFMGSQDSRTAEMATCMPDWFALVALKDDRLHLSILDTIKVQGLLTHPENALEVLDESDVQMTLVRP